MFWLSLVTRLFWKVDSRWLLLLLSLNISCLSISGSSRCLSVGRIFFWSATTTRSTDLLEWWCHKSVLTRQQSYEYRVEVPVDDVEENLQRWRIKFQIALVSNIGRGRWGSELRLGRFLGLDWITHPYFPSMFSGKCQMVTKCFCSFAFLSVWLFGRVRFLFSCFFFCFYIFFCNSFLL